MKTQTVANMLSRGASSTEAVVNSTTPRKAAGDASGHVWLFEIIDDDGNLHRVAITTINGGEQ